MCLSLIILVIEVDIYSILTKIKVFFQCTSFINALKIVSIYVWIYSFIIRHYINEDYVRHGGYNEVGELNDVIILYPQVVPTALNPFGCWDGYGYTGVWFGKCQDQTKGTYIYNILKIQFMCLKKLHQFLSKFKFRRKVGS